MDIPALLSNHTLDGVEQHARGVMEVFGIGPEMFQNRMVAWVKSLSEIVKSAVSELGIITIAIISYVQNVRSKTRNDRLRREATHIMPKVVAVPIPKKVSSAKTVLTPTRSRRKR
jgi:hypothetical protein